MVCKFSEQFSGVVLEPRVVPWGESSFFTSAIEVGPHHLLFHRFLSKAKSLSLNSSQFAKKQNNLYRLK